MAAVFESLEQRRLLAGQGLFGEYFDSPTESAWTAPATRRHDPQIDFSWSSGKMIDGIGTDGAVQWTGLIDIPTAGNYTFFAETDDGVRLWIDGNLVIDDWTEGAGERSSSAIALAAGQHTIKMQYFDTVLNAKAQLRWQGPGIGKQIIPAAALTPGHATTLPAGWTASDIGSGFAAGDEDHHAATGTFTIRGGGQAIGGSADGFRFVRASLTGDGEIIARLSSYGTTHDGNEIGLMLREGDSADARFFGVFGSPQRPPRPETANIR